MLRGFEAPALLVVGMNVFIPADRVFKPLLAGVSQRGFDFGADVCLTDSAVDVGHENDGGNLFKEGTIFGLETRSMRVVGQCWRRRNSSLQDSTFH